MESRFFVEAKSFLFSMVNGSNELRVVEKRKGFFGFVLLGWQCAAWLVSMVEEVLRNTVFEDFVKSYMEGSKVTIVRRGRNRFGRFLEVAVYAMGDRRGMTLFPEGQDGRGWNRVFEELSKALDFLTEGDNVTLRGKRRMGFLGSFSRSLVNGWIGWAFNELG